MHPDTRYNCFNFFGCSVGQEAHSYISDIPLDAPTNLTRFEM